jgi:hypothetical protein
MKNELQNYNISTWKKTQIRGHRIYSEDKSRSVHTQNKRIRDPIKPILPIPDVDDEDEDDNHFNPSLQTQLIVGDVSVSAKGLSLNACHRQIKTILKDRTIKSYLDIYKRQKLFKTSYIE